MTVKIRPHWDADGVTSAYLATFGIEDSEIEFGVYEKGFGDTSGLTKNDWMVDMRPQDPKWNGTCIDHHIPHPEPHKYKLISGEEPATLLTWRHFKDKIPKKEWWKAVIGIGGDVQYHLIPTEIWDSCPTLLKTYKTSAYKKFNWTVYTMPVYKMLSSPVNSYLRKEEYKEAINLIKYADSPLDIVHNGDANINKDDIKMNCKNAIMDSKIVFYDDSNLIVVLFYSKYRMSGYVGSVLQGDIDKKNRTVMAINTRNGSLSLRGDLAMYYRDKLKSLDYLHIDGHPGFMGGKLTKNYNKLLSDLDEIF